MHETFCALTVLGLGDGTPIVVDIDANLLILPNLGGFPCCSVTYEEISISPSYVCVLYTKQYA